MMEFCDVCQNMLYTQIDEERLKFCCKNCNFTKYKDAQHDKMQEIERKIKDDAFNNRLTWLRDDFDGMKAFTDKMFSPFIKYDKTLPRVNNIKCPNCKPEVNEVIYVKYDHDNMNYLYYCCNCEHFWHRG